MLNQLKAAVDLRKEIPDAVGYDTYGPITFPLPIEIRDRLPDLISKEIKDISLLSIRIDNYSSKIQRNIKVLFSGSWTYAPRVSFYRRDVGVKYEIRHDEKEIVLHEIPPNESISIEIFNPTDQFTIEQVLIGDVEVTKLMQKLAQAKRYPKLAKLQLTSTVALVFAAVAVVGAAYVAWGKVAEYREIEAASAGLLSCKPYVYSSASGGEAFVERKYLQSGPFFMSYILFLNKVGSLEELKMKDKVILCDPSKP